MKRKKKKQHKTSVLLFLSLILLLGSVLFKTPIQSSFTKYTENGRVHGEAFFEWPHYVNVGATLLFNGSIFHVNYTVLSTSYSNVSFVILTDIRDENRTIFSPDPPNFVLAPGESFSNTYTIVNGRTDDFTILLHRAPILTEGSNATVHWWFVILKYVEYSSVPGVLFSFGIVTLLALMVIIRRKKKE